MRILPIRNSSNGGYKLISRKVNKIIDTKNVTSLIKHTKNVLYPQTPRALKAHLVFNSAIMFAAFFVAYNSISSIQKEKFDKFIKTPEDGPIMKHLSRYPGCDARLTLEELKHINEEFIKVMNDDQVGKNKKANSDTISDKYSEYWL